MQHALFAHPVLNPAPIGLTSTVSDAERRRLNASALRVLFEAHQRRRFPGPEDRLALGRYSGLGGIGNNIHEYYTPPELAHAIWDLLRALGSPGGSVLEPACGVGVLLQHAPAGARLTGIELEPESASIAALLFPRARILHGSFERFVLSSREGFDTVVMNPPFGPRGAGALSDLPRVSEASAYFALRALEQLNSGGLCAMIVPHGLSSQVRYTELREKLLMRASVRAIYGLPTRSFERAGAKFATCDLWLLQAHAKPVQRALIALGRPGLRSAREYDAKFVAGAHFQRSPSFLLGTPGTAIGHAGRPIFVREGRFDDALARIKDLLPEPAPALLSDELELEWLLARLEPEQLQIARSAASGMRRRGEVFQDAEGRTLMQGSARPLALSEAELHALGQAQQLEELLETHQESLALGHLKDANRLRPQLERLVREHVQGCGVPASSEVLVQSAQVPLLLSRVRPDGSLTPVLTGDAENPPPRFDPADPLSLARALRASGRAVTPGLMQRCGALLSAAALEAALYDGQWCYADGAWLPPEQYYLGDADRVLRGIERDLAALPCAVSLPEEALPALAEAS